MTDPAARDKVVAGLTGSYGSGKSTVARLFQDLGAKVIDADRLAHEALQPGEQPYEAMVRAWGRGNLLADGTVDRAKIAALIFADPEKRRELEGWIHPYVFERMEREVRQSPERVVLLDVPLLFESGLDRRCDWTITVAASPEAIAKRMALKGISDEEVRRRTGAQLSLKEKMKRSDFVIHNEATLETVRQEALQVWAVICGSVSEKEEAN